MANSKISALTSATTPLAGTETLPIVQSGATVKVANNDLRPKQIQSNATSGILQVAGPAAASTRIMTTPDANFTVARTDAAQSFTGDQTLSTGNLIQGTAAKGVNFTANTPKVGMTSQLLNWYEEGTFTPTIAPAIGSLTSYTSEGFYTKVGRTVTILMAFKIVTPGTASDKAVISGLPFTSITTSVSNRAATALVRENNNTGNAYQFFMNSGNTTGEVSSLVYGAISWTASSTYVWSFTYQAI